MCLFSGPVKEVSKTRLFVAALKDGKQLTVYQNKVQGAGSGNNAMILPFPAGDCELVDLSKSPRFFKDVDAIFPKPRSLGLNSRGAYASKSKSKKKLEVFKVGGYIMSIAPTLADLKRVDESQFTLPGGLEQILSEHYDTGFGFLVCLFKSDAKVDFHPIGYITEPSTSSGKSKKSFFVPTRHFHGASTTQVTPDSPADPSNAPDPSPADSSTKTRAVVSGFQEPDGTEDDWDHTIYSVGAMVAGPSFGRPSQGMSSRNELYDVLQKIPALKKRVKKVKDSEARKFRVEGTHPNGDIVLPF